MKQIYNKKVKSDSAVRLFMSPSFTREMSVGLTHPLIVIMFPYTGVMFGVICTTMAVAASKMGTVLQVKKLKK